MASSDNESRHTSRLEQQLRRQLLLNHRLDQEQRDLELRLEEAEHQLAKIGGEAGERRPEVACEDDSSRDDRSDVRALEERLMQMQRELAAEQVERLQVAEQLAVALDQLQKQGTTILSLTDSLDRAAKQLADADARLDLAWLVQDGEDYQLSKSDLMPLACRDASHNSMDNNGDSESHTARLEQRDLMQRRLGETEHQLAIYAATGGGRTRGSAKMADSSCDGRCDLALEERLVQTELELEAEQADRLQAAKERERLEEQLADAHKDLVAAHENTARAEAAAFNLSRRLAGALRAQSNSAKLIARLRKS
eukprot:COSAG02_NODE_31_length_50774_cov_1928.118204_27_plen_310_part_00